MHILLNGKEQKIKENTSISDLVSHRFGIAVAINDEVIPQDRWKKHQLQERDRVEIIAPFQGG